MIEKREKRVLSEKEYQAAKRKYIKENITNDNLYDTFSKSQRNLIRQYYSMYTKNLFMKIRGDLRLEVTKEKAADLAKLKGEGVWMFAGMEDMYKRGAGECEMGHKLRYCYYAKNIQNGAVLVFGSTCVGDFFDLDAEGVKALTKLKDDMLRDIKEMVAVKRLGLVHENVKYDMGLVGRLLANVGVEGLKHMKGQSLVEVLLAFIEQDIPIPGTLVAEVEESRERIKESISAPVLGVDSEVVSGLANSEVTLIAKSVQAGYSKILRDIMDVKETLTDTERVVNRVFGTYSLKGLRERLPKWVDVERKVVLAGEYYQEKGVETPWKDLYVESMRIKGVDAAVQKAVVFMAMMERNAKISSMHIGGSKVYPYKVNGQDIRIEDVSEPEQHIETLGKKESVKTIIAIDKACRDRKSVREREKEQENEKLEYIREELKKEGKTLKNKIAWDIVIVQGKSFSTMSEKQRGVVTWYYTDKKNRERDKKTGKRIYCTGERQDIEKKIQYLEESDRTSGHISAIIENIRKVGKMLPKQIEQIEEEYESQVTGGNRKYSLADREDVLQMLDYIKDVLERGGGRTISVTERNIAGSVRKYGKFSDKQMACIQSAYNKAKEQVS